MFRKRRQFATPLTSSSPPNPSTGRPPTPEPITAQDISRASVGINLTMTSSSTPLIGRAKSISKSTRRTPAPTSGKVRPMANGSILNFFKKATRSPETDDSPKDTEESLFLEDEGPELKVWEPIQTPTPPRDDLLPKNSDFANNLSIDADSSRFNEEQGPVKRRKTEASDSSPQESKYAAKRVTRKGPFLEDSDDGDDEELNQVISNAMPRETRTEKHPVDKQPASPAISGLDSGGKDGNQKSIRLPRVPSLKKEQTSIDDGDGFQGVDDFIDDEFPEEGEEFLERRWMEQQRQFEMDFAEDAELENNQELKTDGVEDEGKILSMARSCPVCSVGFDGFTDQVC